MSKDTDYIENCLEKMSKGNFFFYVSADMLKKKNSAGRMARFIKLIVDNECKKAEALKGITEGNFSSEVQKAGSNDRIGESINAVGATFNKMQLQLNDINDELNKGNKDIRFYEDDYQGGFKAIGASLNRILDTVILPLNEAQRAIKAMTANDFSVRVKDSCVFKEFSKDVNNLCDRLKTIENSIVELADGDFSATQQLKKNGKLSENDKLTPAVVKLCDSTKLLTDETHYIAENCAKGKIFETRGNAEKFDGGSKVVIEDINKILDTVTAALRQSIDVTNALSANNYAVEFDKNLPGDLGKLSSSIDSVRKRMIEIKALSQKIAKGEISGFGKLTDTNRLSEQDELRPAVFDAVKNIRSLITDTETMRKALESGDLLYRIDTSSVNGEYAEILENFNKALEIAANPILKISNALEELAGGNTYAAIDETYTGVFEKLKTDVNAIIKRNQNLVNVITSCLTKIANGNLNIDNVEEFAGDWSSVSTALNNIVDSLNNSMGSIYNTVGEVAAEANQVAGSSQNISQGATEQAGSIEELTTSIAEVASQTQLNASNAGKANSLAKTMSDTAAAGSKEMNEMLESMQEINDSTKNISKIIKVIDDIAFQTNILALNAAVEAAHAGQNGKGFAVVAEEVRNLAARSANAVKDTTSLIKGSIKSVEKGTSIAKNTANTLGNIIDGVDKVAELVENIAAASNEQANSIIQINQGLGRISKVVQSNSATAEQSAAASVELSGQAGILKSNVERFTLRNKIEKHASNEKRPAKNDDAAAKRAQYTQKPSNDLYNDFGKY